MSLLPQAKLSKCVRHTEEKRKKQKARVIRTWGKSLSKRAIRPFFGVSSRVSKTHTEKVRALGGVVWRDREKHSESVREWKRKNVTFFFAQVTHKEDKLMKFLWSFWVLQPWRVGVFRGRCCYWLCGEIVLTLWDLFVVYPIYCGLNFSINLIVVISIS